MKLLLTIGFLLILIAGCRSMDENVMILHNVNGYSIQEGRLARFDAIAHQDGKVLATGNREDLFSMYPDAVRRSGEGRTLLPGLIDAHVHVMGLGFQEMDLNVAGLGSLEETLDMVSSYAAEQEDLEWIRGRGWNQASWEEPDFPTAEDLERAVAGRPIWLVRVDSHAGWASRTAMELAGVTTETEDPPGGRLIRDEQGEPTGIFIDAAMDLIEAVIPERTPEERREALRLAGKKISSLGLTSVHDAGVDRRDWELFTQTADERRLPFRIYAMFRGPEAEMEWLFEQGPVPGYADDRLALRSIKISTDGALGSRGAALLEEYRDEPGNRGLLFFSQEELNTMVCNGASAGFQMNIHAIGDAANRQVLDAFEELESREGKQGLRHRIEHAQVVSLEDIPRFLDLDVLASVQPTHATSDMNMAEDRVGPDRIRGAYAWRTFLEQGTPVAAGSDFPVEPVNPFYGLHAAVTRQARDGNPPEGWYPEQAMSREEAFRAFTLDAAYAAHQEEVLGSLEPGKWADFILIDRDYFEIPASDIHKIQVLETWVAGERQE